MANFTRTRALWADDTDLLYTEIEHIDEQLALAISGEGGVYALVEDLEIGGAPGTGVHFATDVFTVEGVATFNDAVELNGALQINDDAEFLGDVRFAIGAVEFDEAVSFDDNATVAGDFFTLGNVYLGSSTADTILINGESVFLGYATFDDQAEFNSDAFFAADIEIQSGITFSGTGKIIHRQKTITTNADQSVVAANYDTVYIPDGVLTGTKFLTIDDTGARNGMRITFFSLEAAIGNGASIVTPSAVSYPICDDTGSNSPTSWTFERIGGVWRGWRGGDRS